LLGGGGLTTCQDHLVPALADGSVLAEVVAERLAVKRAALWLARAPAS
jgi:hypothetical protein